MTTESTNLLLSWENVERLPELQRLKLVLDTLPSEKVIAALKARRGHGRNDFPVEAMFNALIAGIVFQHNSSSSMLRELHRSENWLNSLSETSPVSERIRVDIYKTVLLCLLRGSVILRGD